MPHPHRKKPAAGMKPHFKAAVKDNGTLELLIYEDIGENYWSYDGGLTAKTVKQKIDDAGEFSNFAVRINSPGGDAFEGVAIANLIRAQKKPVSVYIDGIAASAASILAMCGDTIVMGRGAMMMIHNAWTVCVGNAADFRKMADTMDKIDEGAIAAGYVAKTGKSLEDVKALMDAETWMDAEECVKEGFATSIVDDGEEQKNALAMAKQFKSLAHLKGLPEKLKAEEVHDEPSCECSCDECVGGDCQNCTHENCDCANCTDCPMKASASNQAESSIEDSNLSLYEARLKMLGREAA